MRSAKNSQNTNKIKLLHKFLSVNPKTMLKYYTEMLLKLIFYYYNMIDNIIIQIFCLLICVNIGIQSLSQCKVNHNKYSIHFWPNNENVNIHLWTGMRSNHLSNDFFRSDWDTPNDSSSIVRFSNFFEDFRPHCQFCRRNRRPSASNLPRTTSVGFDSSSKTHTAECCFMKGSFVQIHDSSPVMIL